MPSDRSIAVWSTPVWRTEAVAWMDAQLAAAGLQRTGEVAQPHVRAWATVLRAPTPDGPVWLKACGSGTGFEAGVYELLATAAPDRVLTPIAIDRERAWILLPDGGPSLGERLDGPARVDALADALVAYGKLQRRLAAHVGDLLALGVADMRPAAMPARFPEALAAAGDGEDVDRVAALKPEFAAWCERLSESAVPASLDHNDLHPWNVLDGPRFYDWGDSVVAHPFAAMLVPLGFVARGLPGGEADPAFVRARDAYLDVFADLAPRRELAETLELACRVAKVARALTWERALRSAREQGDALDETYAAAPRETLLSLLDGSYLGGA